MYGLIPSSQKLSELVLSVSMYKQGNLTFRKIKCHAQNHTANKCQNTVLITMLISSHNVNVATSNKSNSYKYHRLNIKPFALISHKHVVAAKYPDLLPSNNSTKQNCVSPPPKFLWLGRL